MNSELEALIRAYEEVSASMDKEAADHMLAFDLLLDKVMERQPTLSRDMLRKSVIKAHRKWALKQDNKPPAMPPTA